MGETPGTLLFSCDTLREPGVQLDTLGHIVPGEDDVLAGYTVDVVAFEDHRDLDDATPSRHPFVRATGNPHDKVIGRVLPLTEDELDACDEHEAPLFHRVPVTLASGREAWVFVGDARRPR